LNHLTYFFVVISPWVKDLFGERKIPPPLTPILTI